MKKTSIIVLMVLFLSGCDAFDFEMLTCKYKQTYTTYEIQYKEEVIKGFTIIREIDLTSLSEENFDLYVEEVEKTADLHSDVKGIDESIEIDQRLITIHIDVDYHDYNVMKDELVLFSVRFEEDDFKDVETLRNKLIQNEYSCDEIVIN